MLCATMTLIVLTCGCTALHACAGAAGMTLLYTVHYNNKNSKNTISYCAITHKCVHDNADGPRCLNPELLYQWQSRERRRLLARKCYLLSKGQVHKYTPNKDIASCGVFHTARLKKSIHSGVTSWLPSRLHLS
jgi:hypothetical protein